MAPSRACPVGLILGRGQHDTPVDVIGALAGGFGTLPHIGLAGAGQVHPLFALGRPYRLTDGSLVLRPPQSSAAARWVQLLVPQLPVGPFEGDQPPFVKPGGHLSIPSG
jgi:hypothetical protein